MLQTLERMLHLSPKVFYRLALFALLLVAYVSRMRALLWREGGRSFTLCALANDAMAARCRLSLSLSLPTFAADEGRR